MKQPVQTGIINDVDEFRRINMVTKEIIKSEIEKVPEERLEELYEVVKTYVEDKTLGDRQSFMSKLKSVRIDGPADFAANVDLYLTGEKSIE